MFKNSIISSDHIGVTANVLCMLHCFATPLLFFSQAQSSTLSFETPFLWQSLNYCFLIISLVAVLLSIKNSTKFVVKFFLITFWSFLSFLIINEGLEAFHIPEFFTYLSASFLSLLHIYNLKYCKCTDEDCCAN